MIDANFLWKEPHERNILPETDVEITCGLATSPASIANIEEVNPADFSRKDGLTNSNINGKPYCVQTLERNLWILDGRTRTVELEGYTNDGSESAGVNVLLKSATNATIPGITIIWGTVSTGYATDFTVTAKKAGEVVATITIEGNKNRTSLIDLEIESYDSLSIDILGWSLPERRVRMRHLILGQQIVFNKANILSYEHEQSGHPNSGGIPQNKIRFVLDNRNDFWDPMNESGAAKYLTERLSVSVRYGMRVDTSMMFVKAGQFFLEDWKVSNDGSSVSFSARDCFEFIQNLPHIHTPSDGLGTHAFRALDRAKEAGANIRISSDRAMNQYQSPVIPPSITEAETVQMCANAACCVIVFRREGAVSIEPTKTPELEYTIPLKFAYSYPEISLSKPLKAVTVSYGDGQKYTLEVSDAGETQTVDNPIVSTAEQAEKIALWVKNTLESRKRVRGEFRSDPRLDLFDVVTVETKYGVLYPVLLTYIKYTYTGTFRASYEGYVITLPEEA